MGNELWQLIMQSDSITKIVYGILFFFLYHVGLFFRKTNFFVKASNASYYGAYFSDRSLDALMTRASFFDHTYAGYVVAKQTQTSKILCKCRIRKIVFLCKNMIELLEYQFGKTYQEIVQDEESLLSVLS